MLVLYFDITKLFLSVYQVWLNVAEIATMEDVSNITTLLYVCVTLDTPEEIATKVRKYYGAFCCSS